MTATENELVEEIRHKILEKVARLDEQKRQIDEKWDGFSRIFSDFDEKIAGTEEDKKPDDSLLQAAKIDMERARYNYQQFKGQNNLLREANEPNLPRSVFWAFMIIAIEGLLNSFFFAEGSSSGLTGGYIYAFGVSFLNVGFAFLAGVLCLPYLRHVNPEKKLGGILGLMFFSVACAVIIVASALYRGAIDGLVDQENLEFARLEKEAWLRVKENLLNINISEMFVSLESSLLVFVGAICAIIGVWKGYSANDPYPGFGEMGKQKLEAEESFNDEQEAYNDDVLQYRRKNRKILDEAMREMQKEFDQLNSGMRGYMSAVKQDENPLQQAKDMSRLLLSDYRNKNWEYRDGDRPSYFEHYPSEGDFPRIAQISREWDARLKNVDDMEERARKLSAEKNERIRKAQQIIREKLSQ